MQTYRRPAQVAALGLVRGWSAFHYRRLGPGIVAHAPINLFVVVTIATR